MTAQSGARIRYEEEDTWTKFPLDFPKEHPRIRHQPEHTIRSTGCWLGYEESWLVEDGRLFLVGIMGAYGLVGSEPLFAEWYHGHLTIPRGKVLHYVHMGWSTVFEEEVFIRVDAGVVTKTSIIDNRNRKFDKNGLPVMDVVAANPHDPESDG